MNNKFTLSTTTSNKNSKLFFIFSTVISVFVIITIIFSDKDYQYSYLFILPLSYLIIILLFSRIYIKPLYNYGFLFYAAQFLLFIRYVITPYSIVITTSEYRPGPSPTIYELQTAYLLMVYELIIIFIVIGLSIYSNKRKKKKNNESTSYKILDNKLVISIFLVFFLSILIMFPHSIFPKQMLFPNEEFNSKEFHGSIEIISIVFRCMAFLFLTSLIKKYIKHRSELINVLLSLIVLIIFLATLTGSQRLRIIFFGLIGVLLVETLYPKYKKLIRIVIISILITMFISISLYKFYWVVDDSGQPIREVLTHLMSQFQAYFSGPRTVAQSLNIKDSFNSISVSTFMNDFLGSVPYLSDFIDQSDRINKYFNIYNYRQFNNTLIMPLVGIGYTYFGFILAPIFSAISQWLVIKLDWINNNERRLEYIFIYSYVGLRLSMSVGYNTQILFSSFLVPTLPLLLILFLNSRVVFKKRNKIKNP